MGKIVLIVGAVISTMVVIGLGYYLVTEPDWGVPIKVIVGAALAASATWLGIRLGAALRAEF